MMDPRVVFLKKIKGEAEIITREHGLNHALRYVLILVDGTSTVGEILSKGAGLPNIEATLDRLAALGFIQTKAEAELPIGDIKHDPKNEIIKLAHALLGEQAGPIIKKLDETNDTPEALAHTANTCKRLIKLSIDDQKAEDFVRRAQEIIFASSLALRVIQQPQRHPI